MKNACDCSACEVYEMSEPDKNLIATFPWFALWFSLVFWFCLFMGCSKFAHAEMTGNPGKIEGYSLNTWVESIHKAEANDNYGILSIPCSTKSECKRICATTVRHNYKRWVKSGRAVTFLCFLQRRYCPIKASNDPSGKNAFWARNVAYFLRKEA